MRRCVTLAREYTRLEQILGIADERQSPPEYDLPAPRARWDAICQGELLAEQDRDRVGLGSDPIRDIRTVLEQQGIRVLTERQLPDNISGVFINDPRHGLAVIVNGQHSSRRQLFSYAHEYAHALADRDTPSLVSKSENRSELREVRANAFAAAFLMPETGVQSFMRSRGKAAAPTVMQVYDESEALSAQRRQNSRGPEIQLYDVVHVASHFGTSFDSTLYRLLNLRMISDSQRRRFAAQREPANAIRQQWFGETEQDEDQRQRPHEGFLFLALDAFYSAQISRGKLNELAALADAEPGEVDKLAAEIEDEREDQDQVLLPAATTPGR